MIKEIAAIRWPKIEYFKDVLLVLTVPAEFSEQSKAIMRICAFNAGLIKEEYRLPLVPMSAKNREKLKATMKACGILK